MPINNIMVSRIYFFTLILLFLTVFSGFSQRAPGPGELAEAVDKGDVSLIETLLLRGAKPDQPDAFGETPLLYGVKSEKNELVRIILDAGADPDIPGSENLTALMKSVEMSRDDLVVLLLSRGADPNLIMDILSPEITPVSALSLALDRGEYEIAGILVNLGASPLFLKDSGEGSPNPLKLPELKIPLDARIWRDTAVLQDFAVEAGDLEWRILRDKFDNGVSVDLQDTNGVSALMVASWYGNVPVMNLLIQRGADLFQKDINGCDALCYAAAAGETAALNVLLNRIEGFEISPDIFIGKGQLNQTALYFAVGNRNHGVLNLLLESDLFFGVLQEGTDEEGITLLMMAAWLSDLYAVDALLPLSDGAFSDDAGRRALAWSAAAFSRDRNSGRGSRNYPVARLLASRLRNPDIYSTQPTEDLDEAVINAWSPGLSSGGIDHADDWRNLRPSPVPSVSGNGDITLYRIFRDEEPGTPSS